MNYLKEFFSSGAALPCLFAAAAFGTYCFAVIFCVALTGGDERGKGKYVFLWFAALFEAVICAVSALDGALGGVMSDYARAAIPPLAAVMFLFEYAVLAVTDFFMIRHEEKSEKRVPGTDGTCETSEAAVAAKPMAEIVEIPIRAPERIGMDKGEFGEKFLFECVGKLRRAELSEDDKIALDGIEAGLQNALAAPLNRRNISEHCGALIALLAKNKGAIL